MNQRFIKLVNLYLDGGLSAHQMAELEAELHGSEAARNEFLQRVRLHVAIREVVLQQDGETLARKWGVAEKTRIRPTRPVRVMKWLAVAATVLLAVGMIWQSERNKPLARVSRITVVNAGPGGGFEREEGELLRRGPVELGAGAMELTFFSGARVVFEGPGRLEIRDPKEVVLRQGRLSVTIEPRGHGFTVRGDGFRVVDLGTKFVVDRPAPGSGSATEVQVVEGVVEVVSGGSQRVHANEALRLEHGHAARAPWRPEMFFVPQRFEAFEATRSLREHPACLVHLDFGDSGTPLVNRAVNGGGIEPVPQGVTPIDGRWPGSGAMRWANDTDRVRLSIPGEFQELTLVAWVWIDELPHRQSGLAMSGSELPGDVHWFLFQNGTIGFGAIGPDGYWHQGTRPRLVTTANFKRWMLLAATFNGGRVSHYVDGKFVSSHSLEGVATVRPGLLDIGNWPVRPGDVLRASRRYIPPSPESFNRAFRGRIDEFSMLSKALSAPEIQKLYEDGYPR
jgi:hypothetical protein